MNPALQAWPGFAILAENRSGGIRKLPPSSVGGPFAEAPYTAL